MDFKERLNAQILEQLEESKNILNTMNQFFDQKQSCNYKLALKWYMQSIFMEECLTTLQTLCNINEMDLTPTQKGERMLDQIIQLVQTEIKPVTFLNNEDKENV